MVTWLTDDMLSDKDVAIKELLDLFPLGYISETTDWLPPEYRGAVCDPNQQCGVSENRTTPVTDAWHGMFQNCIAAATRTLIFPPALPRLEP